MKHFIFITTEGYTFKPESDFAEPEVDNCQVLGFTSGMDAKEAFKNFANEGAFYRELNFDEVICYELKDPKSKKYFYLSNLK